MKKNIVKVLVLLLCLSFLSGCADTKVINNVEYDTYGLFSKDEK